MTDEPSLLEVRELDITLRERDLERSLIQFEGDKRKSEDTIKKLKMELGIYRGLYDELLNKLVGDR